MTEPTTDTGTRDAVLRKYARFEKNFRSFRTPHARDTARKSSLARSAEMW